MDGGCKNPVQRGWGFYYTANLTTEGVKTALENAYRAAKAVSDNVVEGSRIRVENTYRARAVKIDPRYVLLEEKVKAALEFDR